MKVAKLKALIMGTRPTSAIVPTILYLFGLYFSSCLNPSFIIFGILLMWLLASLISILNLIMDEEDISVGKPIIYLYSHISKREAWSFIVFLCIAYIVLWFFFL